MVAPVTGPFTKSEWINAPYPHNPGLKLWFRESTTYKQAKPYNLRLPYSLKVGNSWKDYGDPLSSYLLSANDASLFVHNSSSLNDAKSKAWAKLVEHVRERCEAAVALAEYRQAAGMLTSRLGQLFRFARDVKRLRFSKAISHLSLNPKAATAAARKMRDRWSRDRDLANVWLEVHFGWAPLLGDIHDALEVMTSPSKSLRCFGKAKGALIEVKSSDSAASRFYTFQSQVQYLCYVDVSNPNVGLLAQFGMTNPLSVAWELVPWSFLVDHIVNVSQVIGMLSDFHGLTVSGAMTTRCQFQSRWQKWKTVPALQRVTGFSMDRVTGFDQPTLHIRPLKGPSVTRALTYASLLMSKMPVRRG